MQYSEDNELIYTLFSKACIEGNENTLQQILRTNSDESLKAWFVQTDKNGLTCFDYACINGHETVVRAILQRLPFFVETLLTTENFFESTPIELACSPTSKKTLPLLLKAIPNHALLFLTKKDSVGNTLLHYLIINSLNQAFEDVLNTYLDVSFSLLSQTDYIGNTPLHLACSLGKIEALNTILNSSINSAVALLKKTDFLGNTPLHQACFNGHTFVVEAILKIAKELNPGCMVNNEGDTPIHIACQKGFILITNALLKHDINQVNIKNRLLLTPLELLIKNKNHLMIQNLLTEFPQLITLFKESYVAYIIENAFLEGNSHFAISYAKQLTDQALLSRTMQTLFQKQAIIATSLEENLQNRIIPLLEMLRPSLERDKTSICKERWSDLIEAKKYRVNQMHIAPNNPLNENYRLFPEPTLDLESLRQIAEQNSSDSEEFSGLYLLLDCVKERKPYIGTPPAGQVLERFYTKLTALLKHNARNCDDKLLFCRHLDELGRACGERWLISNLKVYRMAKSNPTSTTSNKDSVLFYLHEFREHLLEQVIAKYFGTTIDAHILGRYERRIGPLFDIMETENLTQGLPTNVYVNEGEIIAELFRLYISPALFWEARDFFAKNRDTCIEVAQELDPNNWSKQLTETGLLSSKQLGEYLNKIGALQIKSTAI